VAAAVHDIALYYAETGVDFWIVYLVATVFSGIVVAGIGARLLVRALVGTGVLAPFAVGRDQREI
jgi:energy-coupling factor transport system substrate-specific component